MNNVFEAEVSDQERVRVLMIFMLATALFFVFQSIALGLSIPATNSFVYDIYDLAVNKILKGAPGFVIGCGAIAWGGSHMLKSQVVPAVMSILGGGLMLKADAVVATLGMTII